MKPLMYSQHYGGQPGYGCVPPDGGFQNASLSSHMGLQRMPHGYPPMMRMPGNAGPRAVGMRAVGSNPAGPPQPNNLRLQLQHRLQAQLVGAGAHAHSSLIMVKLLINPRSPAVNER